MIALNEGLASKGYVLVNLILKYQKSLNISESEEILVEKFDTLNKEILHYFNKELSNLDKYALISFENKATEYLSFIKFENFNRIILINPLIENKQEIELSIENLNDKDNINNLNDLFIVLSEKRNKVRYNQNMVQIKNDYNNSKRVHLKVFENSSFNFKFYESILLAHLIQIIN